MGKRRPTYGKKEKQSSEKPAPLARHQRRQLLGRRQPGAPRHPAALWRGIPVVWLPLGGAGGVFHRQGFGCGFLPPGGRGRHAGVPGEAPPHPGPGRHPQLHPGGGRPHRGGKPHGLLLPRGGPGQRQGAAHEPRLRCGVHPLPGGGQRRGPFRGPPLRLGPVHLLVHPAVRLPLEAPPAGGEPFLPPGSRACPSTGAVLPNPAGGEGGAYPSPDRGEVHPHRPGPGPRHCE